MSDTARKHDAAIRKARLHPATDYNSEPPIEEMLEDPTVQAVMARDHVTRADLMDVVTAARRALGHLHRAERAAEDVAYQLIA